MRRIKQSRVIGIGIILIGVLLAGCAGVRSYEDVSPALGNNHQVLLGGIVVRVERSKDLPNAFGGRDIFGGKVGLGYSELRYLGLTEDRRLKFGVSQVTVQSAESTMTRYGAGGTLPTLDKTRDVNPLTRSEFFLDLRETMELEFEGYLIRIRAPRSHDLQYDLSRKQ